MARSTDHTETHDDTDSVLLVQSRALGDPTRNAVFAYVRDATQPVGVAELTEHFGLNHNAIRQHLAKLRDADLVLEERGRPAGPGRPPLHYRAVPGAVDRWGGTGPYEALSMMLIDVLRGDGSPREIGRRAGRELAGEYGTEADTMEILDAVARRMGFEPHREQGDDGSEVVLDRCPFVGPAAAAPDIVCDLHRGISEGIAEAVGDGAEVCGLVTNPPERAGCRIQVTSADEDA